MKKLLISIQFMILLLLFGRSNIFASEIKTQSLLNLKYDDTYDITQNSSYEGYEIKRNKKCYRKIKSGSKRTGNVAEGYKCHYSNRQYKDESNGSGNSKSCTEKPG